MRKKMIATIVKFNTTIWMWSYKARFRWMLREKSITNTKRS